MFIILFFRTFKCILTRIFCLEKLTPSQAQWQNTWAFIAYLVSEKMEEMRWDREKVIEKKKKLSLFSVRYVYYTQLSKYVLRV